jgi:menaquinone reductase, multiheme cytochrome c subunit
MLMAVAGVLLVGGGVTGAMIVAQTPTPVTQPLAFSHARHAAEDLGCTDCHAGASTGHSATLPPTSMCLLCHGEALGDHPDEPRVREYGDQGQEIPWRRVNRLPGHVHFSHVAHVTHGQMQCAECHGDVAQRTEPVDRPQITHLDMARCEACHAERGASKDCLACHK